MIPLLLLLTLPPACDEPEARAFDFWVGEWNVLNRWRAESGEWVDAGRATNQVFHVLDGCAVVELWDGRLGTNHFRGFSVRAWEPATEEWVLVLNWPRPGGSTFSTLRGAFRHGRGDFHRESVNADGDTVLTRYTFSDIAPASLRWNDGTSLDGGRTWATQWIMEFTRRDPVTDPPLRNVPLADPGRTRLCPADAARAFDAYLGEWTSTDGLANLESIAIIGECAILDQLAWRDAEGTDREALFVRALAPDTGEWVQYALDTVDRRFVRYTGEGPGGLVSEGGGAMRWTLTGEGGAMTLHWQGAPGGARTFELRRAR